jgi:hypothetical protein
VSESGASTTDRLWQELCTAGGNEMTSSFWSVVFPCMFCVVRVVQSNTGSADVVEKLIKELQPRTVSVANPALEYRIREERAWANRWDAVNQLMGMGPAAAPAVPILTRLIEDRFEPKQLKIKMIMALSNIGPPAAGALAAINRLSASGDPDLRQAADAARWEIKTKAELMQFIEANRESEIEGVLPSLDKIGLLALPILCRILDSPNLSKPLRDKAVIQLEKIRLHNDQSLFSYSKDYGYRWQTFYTKTQSEEIMRAITVADSLILERLSGDLSPKVIDRLVMAVLHLSKQQNDPQGSQRLAGCLNALGRQTVSLSQCPDETFKLLEQSFGNLAKHPSMQELTRLAMIRFIKSRRDPVNFCSALLSAPSLSTSSLILNLIRNYPQDFVFLRTDSHLSAKHYAELCLVCEGTRLLWLDDYRLVATWTCPSSGSLFGGGGGTVGTPVRVHDVQSGVCLGELGLSSIDPVVSRDGKYLLIGGTNEASVWAINPMKLHMRIGATNVERAAFSPSGDKFLIVSRSSESFDFSAGKISIWETKTGVEVQDDLLSRASLAVGSQDGSMLAIFQKDNPGTLIVWDFENGAEVARIDATFLDARNLAWAWILGTSRFSKDGKRLIVCVNFEPKLSTFYDIDLATKVLRAGPWRNIVGRIAGIEDGQIPFSLKSVEALGPTEWRISDLADPDFDLRIDFGSPLHPLNSFLATNQNLDRLNLQFLTQQLLSIQDGERRLVLDLSTNQLDLPLTNEMVGIANHRRVHDRSMAWRSKQGTMIRNTETGVDEKWTGLQSTNILSFIDLDTGPLIALQQSNGIQIVRFHSFQTLFRVLK